MSNASATAAAIWSAVAATVSATAALVAVYFNRSNLHQSVRPELQLLNWQRESVRRGTLTIDVLRIGEIQNVGRGPAMNVVMILEGGTRYRTPMAFMSTKFIPLLAPDKREAADIEVSMHWENVKEGKGGGKFLSLSLVILSWDTLGRRHKTVFSIFAVELANSAGAVLNPIVPGVMMPMRRTWIRSPWTLRLQTQLSRLPFLGRLAP